MRFEKLKTTQRNDYIKNNYDLYFAMSASYILKQECCELTFAKESLVEIKKMDDFFVKNESILSFNKEGINSIFFTDILESKIKGYKQCLNYGSVFKILVEVDRMLGKRNNRWDFGNMSRFYEIIDLLMLDNKIINKELFDYSLLDNEFKEKFKLFKLSFV